MRKQVKKGIIHKTQENKMSKRLCVAFEIPTDVLQAHSGMDTVDLLLFLIAMNRENRYIVVEALAGCGKTAMLTGLIRRIDQKSAVLLLSFTRQAITIAKVRADDNVNVQTFDSLFYQTVKHGYAKEMNREMETSSLTYEDFRDLSETLSDDDLQDFVSQTKSRYKMEDIGYILVDEAQDTPPQAIRILETFRDMGKTIIITGDRHQAIFGFMQTQSLFDSIPSHAKTLHFLQETRRCCHDVVDYLNKRFDIGMKSAYTSRLGPETIESVCVQTQYNATLGRLYAKFLFTLDTVLEVKVSEGDSTKKFWDAVFHETSRIYSLPLEKARDVVEHRQQTLSLKHRKMSQLPRQWQSPLFVFSTVHHFKGGECDITILGEDVGIHDKTCDAWDETERMKYVAGSRARWGIVDLKSFSWKGHATARALFHRTFLKCREKSCTRGQAPRISSVSDMPVCIVPLITSPILTPWMDEFRKLLPKLTSLPVLNHPTLPPKVAMKLGSLVDIFVGWRVEQQARQHHVPHIHVYSSEYLANPLRDRKYVHLRRQNLVSADVHTEIKRIIARFKIQATFGRYLVVFHNWRVTSPMIVRAALAKSRLQSFVLCGNIQTLQREQLSLLTKVKLGQLMERSSSKATILNRPETWVSVNLQQGMPPNSFFFYRGNYDVLIVDKFRTTHLIEVKTVRNVSPTHLLQTLLYTTVVHLSLHQKGMTWRNYIYETNRNELCFIDPQPLLTLAKTTPAIFPELDLVLYAKVLPLYYSNDLSIESIVSLL